MEATNTKVYSLRFNEEDKQSAERIFRNLGMSFNTGINVYLKTVIKEKKIPFILEITELTPAMAFKEAFKIAQEQSVINGTDEMTMDEIDAEIAAYRREKKRGL